MIQIGKLQILEDLKKTNNGVYFIAPSGSREDCVLLPKNQVPGSLQLGDQLELFIYKDSEDRPIATTASPRLQLGEVALLKVVDTSPIGAFLDWGLAKDLLLPFKEQTKKVHVGDEILAALYLDKSHRLCATMNVYEYLSSDSPYKKDDKVSGIVYELSSQFGVFVAVDNKFSAIIPRKEVFRDYQPGDLIENARVTDVREDGKLNLSVREKTFIQMDEDSLLVYEKLKNSDGFLPFHDKSDPEQIKTEFGLSKNAFKRAIGRLFKEHKIRIENNGIYLTQDSKMQQTP